VRHAGWPESQFDTRDIVRGRFQGDRKGRLYHKTPFPAGLVIALVLQSELIVNPSGSAGEILDDGLALTICHVLPDGIERFGTRDTHDISQEITFSAAGAWDDCPACAIPVLDEGCSIDTAHGPDVVFADDGYLV
jgi:hypothetical protein